MKRRKISQGEATLVRKYWTQRPERVTLHATQREFVRKKYVKTMNGAAIRILGILERCFRDPQLQDNE